MSDILSSPIVVGFFFILRCLIPVGLLLGISYLLKRLELVIDHAAEVEEQQQPSPEPAPAPTPIKKPATRQSPPKNKKGKQAGAKKKNAPRKKKNKELINDKA